MNLLGLGLQQGNNAFNAEDEAMRQYAQNYFLNQQVKEAQARALGEGLGAVAGYETAKRLRQLKQQKQPQKTADSSTKRLSEPSLTQAQLGAQAAASTPGVGETPGTSEPFMDADAQAVQTQPGTSSLTGRILHWAMNLDPWSAPGGS